MASEVLGVQIEKKNDGVLQAIKYVRGKLELLDQVWCRSSPDLQNMWQYRKRCHPPPVVLFLIASGLTGVLLYMLEVVMT